MNAGPQHTVSFLFPSPKPGTCDSIVHTQGVSCHFRQLSLETANSLDNSKYGRVDDGEGEPSFELSWKMGCVIFAQYI